MLQRQIRKRCPTEHHLPHKEVWVVRVRNIESIGYQFIDPIAWVFTLRRDGSKNKVGALSFEISVILWAGELSFYNLALWFVSIAKLIGHVRISGVGPELL